MSMSPQLNHTIVNCRDPDRSAAFVTRVLGLRAPTHFGPFTVVTLGNAVSLDYLKHDGTIAEQHYAFLIDDDHFDDIFARVLTENVEWYADPGRQRRGEINRRDGGRGFYFDDPDGHLLEVLTRPHGSGAGEAPPVR